MEETVSGEVQVSPEVELHTWWGSVGCYREYAHRVGSPKGREDSFLKVRGKRLKFPEAIARVWVLGLSNIFGGV